MKNSEAYIVPFAFFAAHSYLFIPNNRIALPPKNFSLATSDIPFIAVIEWYWPGSRITLRANACNFLLGSGNRWLDGGYLSWNFFGQFLS